MKRIVQPELLDVLTPDDLGARRSRRDLQCLNSIMRHHTCLAGALLQAVNGRPPERIAELGAGDGHFLLRVAQRLAPHWPNVKVTLLDQQPTFTEETRAGFAALGWPTEEIVADALGWAENPNSVADVVVANLFLHHLQATQLARLFAAIAQRARLFVAVEPRRSTWPLFCSRQLWLLGCNTITRYDAQLSVQAGFAGCELSALWPPTREWELTESSAGLFSHLFSARHKK